MSELATRKQTIRAQGRLKIMLESAPDAYYLHALNGIFLDGNQAAEELTGYPREKLIGESFLKLKLLFPSQISGVVALLAKNTLGEDAGPDEFVLELERRKPGHCRGKDASPKDQRTTLGVGHCPRRYQAQVSKDGAATE